MAQNEIHVRLSWKGQGKRIHGQMVMEWKRVTKDDKGPAGMIYGIWSITKQMWILNHFVPDENDVEPRPLKFTVD